MARFFSLLTSWDQTHPNQESDNPQSDISDENNEIDRDRLVERARQFKKENERTFRRLARE